MIPYNAFWTGNGIRYYDQEFCVKNCPVGYILFRALFYTWIHIPELEQVLPLEQAKKELRLAENWEAFRKREELFVTANRNYDRFSQIYRWAGQACDIQRIEKNKLQLISADPLEQRLKMLEAVHGIQKELLLKLDQVCRKFGLRYTAIHGTLLGAVRHRGFIPWDDDVDIAMPREDYDRLLTMAPQVFAEPYFLQTPANSENVFYGGYAKLRHSGTAAIEPQHKGRNCHQGIWIDIFPLDFCPENGEKRMQLQKRITFWQRLLMAKLYRPGHGMPEDINPKILSFYYLAARCLRRRWIRRRLEQLFRSCGKSDKLAILACYYGEYPNPNVYPADLFSSLTELPFEDFQIPVPKEYDKILSERYGSNYKELPAKEKRLLHKSIIFSADIPWWKIK
jgi:phosphorylcholine metabolism protein LicD